MKTKHGHPHPFALLAFTRDNVLGVLEIKWSIHKAKKRLKFEVVRKVVIKEDIIALQWLNDQVTCIDIVDYDFM